MPEYDRSRFWNHRFLTGYVILIVNLVLLGLAVVGLARSLWEGTLCKQKRRSRSDVNDGGARAMYRSMSSILVIERLWIEQTRPPRKSLLA